MPRLWRFPITIKMRLRGILGPSPIPTSTVLPLPREDKKFPVLFHSPILLQNPPPTPLSSMITTLDSCIPHRYLQYVGGVNARPQRTATRVSISTRVLYYHLRKRILLPPLSAIISPPATPVSEVFLTTLPFPIPPRSKGQHRLRSSTTNQGQSFKYANGPIGWVCHREETRSANEAKRRRRRGRKRRGKERE